MRACVCNYCHTWCCFSDDEDVRKFDAHPDYNVSVAGHCYGALAMKTALHVDPRVTVYKDKDPVTDKLFGRGAQLSVASFFTEFLREIKVLLYNGVYDLTCNYMGEDKWVTDLNWEGQAVYNSLGLTPW